jgi:hypothetical protein
MSIYSRVVLRLAILGILMFAFVTLRPTKAIAFDCQQQCTQADLACQRGCNTLPPAAREECRIECGQNLQDCLAGC